MWRPKHYRRDKFFKSCPLNAGRHIRLQPIQHQLTDRHQRPALSFLRVATRLTVLSLEIASGVGVGGRGSMGLSSGREQALSQIEVKPWTTVEAVENAVMPFKN